MAVVLLWSNPHIGDEEANVIYLNKKKGTYILQHTTCGEVFEFSLHEETQVCPHCKGDIVIPREDW